MIEVQDSSTYGMASDSRSCDCKLKDATLVLVRLRIFAGSISVGRSALDPGCEGIEVS